VETKYKKSRKHIILQFWFINYLQVAQDLLEQLPQLFEEELFSEEKLSLLLPPLENEHKEIFFIKSLLLHFGHIAVSPEYNNNSNSVLHFLHLYS
jgi:hypothetical protein